MPIDLANIAKISTALAARKADFQSARDAEEDVRWERECAGDDVIMLARRLARAWDRPPPGLLPSVSTPEDVECLVEEVLDYATSLFSLAGVIERDEKYKEAEASGSLRRNRPVILGPRVRSVAGLQREPGVPKAKGENGKSVKMSRTDKWRAEQEAQAAAREALLPPRPDLQPAPQQTELGWHRGEIISFDEIRKTGTVKFVGMIGISEAEISPDVAIRSGHANFFRGERVDCRLVRRLDGSVGIEAIKMAAGADPRGSAAAEAAAEAEQRIRIQLDRRWLN